MGVVGGGQLARMLQPAAVALGVRLRLLADTAADSAAQVIPDTVIGDYRDLDTLRAFAQGCAVLTFDHEHVPTEHLRTLVRDGVAVRPGPDALVFAQDKGLMRERLAELDVPLPRWQPVAAVVRCRRVCRSSGVPARAEGHPRWVRRQGRLGREQRGTRPLRCSRTTRCPASSPKSSFRTRASSLRSWHAARVDRRWPTPWWRRCSATGSVTRCTPPRRGSPTTTPSPPSRRRSGSPVSSTWWA